MHELECPYRLNVRGTRESETAHCDLIRREMQVPLPAVVVDRRSCELCCEFRRSVRPLNPVLPSLMFSACESAIRNEVLSHVELEQVQELYEQAEQALIQQDTRFRFSSAHCCDVFICCDDSSARTRQAVESVLNQEDAVAVLHLIDDGGGAAPLLREYGRRWNVVCHSNPRPLGLYASVQRYFTECRTQFLAFQTPDSVSHPERIGRSVATLVDAGAELFAAAVERGCGLCLPTAPNDEYGRYLALETLVVRRATFADAGGFALDNPGPDAEFVYRAFLENRAFELSDECLCRSSRAEPDTAVTSRPPYTLRNGLLRHHATGFPYETVACDVIIPFRDHVAWLNEAIESVLAQDGADVQIHVIDDDSRENTDELLRYWSSHPRIRTYRNLKNLGQYASFNNVSEFCETGLAVVQDADDISLPHRVHSTGNLLRLSDAGFYCAAEVLFVDESVPETVTTDRRGRPFRRYWSSEYPAGGDEDYFALNPTTAFRTSAFRSLNGYADYGEPARNRAGLDTEFQLRAWFAGVRFAISRQIVTRCRIHPGSATQGAEVGFGSAIREQALEERFVRRRLFRHGCEPRVFGGLGRYREFTVSFPDGG